MSGGNKKNTPTQTNLQLKSVTFLVPPGITGLKAVDHHGCLTEAQTKFCVVTRSLFYVDRF